MFFRIRLAPDTSITGVVGITQTLYWFKEDVEHVMEVVLMPSLQLSDVLPENYPWTFGFPYTTRIVTTEQLVECLREFKNGGSEARSAAFRFASWILRDEGDLTPAALHAAGFDRAIQFPTDVLPEVKIVARGGRVSFEDLREELVAAFRLTYQGWYDLQSASTWEKQSPEDPTVFQKNEFTCCASTDATVLVDEKGVEFTVPSSLVVTGRNAGFIYRIESFE